MEEKMLIILGTILFVILGMIGIMLLSIPLSLYTAWCITTLWSWFAVPYGLPQLSYATAVGLVLIVSILKGNLSVKKDDNKTLAENVGIFIGVLLAPLLTVGVGYLIKLFI
jgi:hypothetical protein